MPSSPGMRGGVAWYGQADWARLRAVAADPGDLEDTYEEWVEVFNRGIRTLASAGIVAERIHVGGADLEVWCSAEGRPIDAPARAEFASRLLQRRYERAGGTPPGSAT